MMKKLKDLGGSRAKLSLAKATDSVRNKFEQLRNERLETSRLLEKQYKPITQKLVELIDSNPKIKRSATFVDNDDEDRYSSDDIVKKKRKVKFSHAALKNQLKNEFLGVNDRLNIARTSLSSKPTSSNVREPIRKPIVVPRKITRSVSIQQREEPGKRMTRAASADVRHIEGKGIPSNINLLSKQLLNNVGNVLTYWDDPNELVQRLQLLVSSNSAGHTGHNNEIISIIEELREANIIA